MLQLNEILACMGINAELRGDTGFEMLAHADASDAPANERRLTFVIDSRYTSAAPENSVVLTLPEHANLLGERGVCVCENPRLLFYKIHNFLSCNENYKRRPRFDTQIGNNCIISPLAHIAKTNVIIGDNVTIEEFVSVRENTKIGDNCIIRAGSIIGGEGFEVKRSGEEMLSVAHLGGTVIGDNVEIQHNTVVDTAVYPWDDTVIGDYGKIDNLIHIAHGVKIGKRALIVANSLIGGRTVIGDDVWLGASVTLSNVITIGNDVRVNIGGVATRNVPDNASVTGNFAIEHSKFIRNLKEWNKD